MSGRVRVRWWWWSAPVVLTAAALGLAVAIHDLVGIVVWSAFTIFCLVLLWAAWSERRRSW